MSLAHRIVDGILQIVTSLLLLGLAILVICAIVFRYSGNSLIFYDEIASVMLAWLTYYGAALAASRRAHLGLDAGLRAMPPKTRKIAFIISETVIISFFTITGYYGYLVLQFLAGEALISLPWFPMVVVQSVIPIGALCFIIAQALSLPGAWRDTLHGRSADERELAEALAHQEESSKTEGKK